MTVISTKAISTDNTATRVRGVAYRSTVAIQPVREERFDEHAP